MTSDLGLFIEEDFDYAHFIPGHPKCYPIHGHTAKFEVRLKGSRKDFDMIIDFGELKKIVKKAADLIDHKLIVSKKYLKKENNGIALIEYDKFKIEAPIANIYFLENEATTENLAEELCAILLKNLPLNIDEVEVVIYEGNRKGAFATRHR